MCDSGYYLDSGACTLITTGTAGEYSKTYYVKNVATGTIDFSADLTAMKAVDGESLGNAFQFLEEVFYTVYSDTALLANNKNEIEVILEDGTEHFFFSCHNDLYSDYEWDENTSYTDLCKELPRLQ